MIDQHFDELIDRHLNGVIEDHELVELEGRLLYSAADRERFWKLAEVHSFLHERLQGEVGCGDERQAHLHPAAQPSFTGRTSNIFSIFQRPGRSIAALAAGVLIGLCCASAVWAMVGHGRLSKLTPLPLVDGSFESSNAPSDEGVPIKTGVWGGDFAANVERADDIAPIAGRRMLRFLRGDNRLTPPDVKSSVAEIWQVVELDAERRKTLRQSQVVEVGAKFNVTATAASEKVAFGVSVLAFAGDVVQGPELWRERRELALATSDKEELADSRSDSWQKLTAQVTVPRETNLLLVQLRVTRKGPGPLGQEFGGHFVDDVTLGLRNADQ